MASEITGRTWADVAHRYSGDPSYLYLVVFLVIVLPLATTGNLTNVRQGAVAAILVVTAWAILWLIQRRTR